MSTPQQQGTTVPPTTPVAGAALVSLSTSREGRLVALDENGGLWRLLYPGERPGEVPYTAPGAPAPAAPVTILTWEALKVGRYLP